MKRNIDKLTEPGKGKLASMLDFILFLCSRPGRQYAAKLLRKRFRPQKIEYHQWITENLKTRTMAGGHPFSEARIEIIPVTKDITTVVSLLQEAPEAKYYMFLDEGATLTPDWRLVVELLIEANPAVDLVYADEDVLSNGSYTAPYFKPGWSPDTLLTRNYIGNTFLISRRILEKCGGIRAGYGASALHDLLLRAGELTRERYHLPDVLIHKSPQAVSVNTDINVIKDTLTRRNTPASVTPVSGLPGVFHVNYKVLSYDKVSIIIPTKDQAVLLRKAVDSILRKTSYPDYEIIILDNNSTTQELFHLKEEYQRSAAGKVRFVDAPFPFNFAKLMNLGVSLCSGKYILMLNNDVEVINGDWLTKMTGYAQLPHVGAVGTKLLYPDNTVQHAGIALGVNDGDAGHVFVNAPANDTGYHGSLAAATNYAAVTAACLLCRKEAYEQVSGMDEQLAIEYNDIDLCLAFGKAGYHNVVLPEVTLYHYESATRAHPFRSRTSWRQHEKELSIFKAKWPELGHDDPYFNKNILRIKNLFASNEK